MQALSSHVLFLMQQKKKNDKSPTNRFVIVPNLSALESGGVGNGHPNRLDPIPNSPVHDIEFNNSKPLPQPVPPKEPKTFLRWAPSHQCYFFIFNLRNLPSYIAEIYYFKNSLAKEILCEIFSRYIYHLSRELLFDCLKRFFSILLSVNFLNALRGANVIICLEF